MTLSLNSPSKLIAPVMPESLGLSPSTTGIGYFKILDLVTGLKADTNHRGRSPRPDQVSNGAFEILVFRKTLGYLPRTFTLCDDRLWLSTACCRSALKPQEARLELPLSARIRSESNLAILS